MTSDLIALVIAVAACRYTGDNPTIHVPTVALEARRLGRFVKVKVLRGCSTQYSHLSLLHLLTPIMHLLSFSLWEAWCTVGPSKQNRASEHGLLNVVL